MSAMSDLDIDFHAAEALGWKFFATRGANGWLVFDMEAAKLNASEIEFVRDEHNCPIVFEHFDNAELMARTANERA
jgi:hypothetical protein